MISNHINEFFRCARSRFEILWIHKLVHMRDFSAHFGCLCSCLERLPESLVVVFSLLATLLRGYSLYCSAIEVLYDMKHCNAF